MEQPPTYRKASRQVSRSSADSPAGEDLTTVATPKQARSEATLQRILDAAERLICEKGFAAVRVSELAAAAKSSVGGFYARFRDKDELLRALNEREHVKLTQTLEQLTDPRMWKNATLRSMVRTLLAAHEAQLQGRTKLMAAVLEATARDPQRWAPAVAFRRKVVDAIAEVLLLRRDEIKHPDPERATRFALSQALAVTDSRALYAHVDDLHVLSDDEIRQELEHTIVGYLCHAPEG